MKNNSQKIKVIMIVLIIVGLLFGGTMMFNMSNKEYITVGVDASIPMVSDEYFDENNEYNIALSDKLFDSLKKVSKVKGIKLYEEGQRSVNDKIEDMNKCDLVISIQSYNSEDNAIKTYVMPPYVNKHDESLKMANMLKEHAGDMNYLGNFYYLLEPFRPGYYREHIVEVSEECVYQESIPYFDLSTTNSIMIEYNHKDNEYDDKLINMIIEAVESYYGLENE